MDSGSRPCRLVQNDEPRCGSYLWDITSRTSFRFRAGSAYHLGPLLDFGTAIRIELLGRHEHGLHALRAELFLHLRGNNELFDLAIKAVGDRARRTRRQPDPVPGAVIVTGNTRLADGRHVEAI